MEKEEMKEQDEDVVEKKEDVVEKEEMNRGRRMW